MVGDRREPRVDSFHDMLQQRVESWLGTEESRTIACAELYRHLPGMFLFLTRVALDPRLPEPERRGVLAALKYVVAPFDLIPEGVIGTSGFRDDLVLAALVVDRLYARADHGVLDESWQGDGDPQTIARAVLEAGEAMVGSEICERLREWLSR